MTTILHVFGDEKSAMLFERHFNSDDVYKDMVAEGVTEKTFESDDYYIEVRIREFKDVDPDFISFMFDNFVDYDSSKDEDIHVVKQ